jgi:hypothetical protein
VLGSYKSESKILGKFNLHLRMAMKAVPRPSSKEGIVFWTDAPPTIHQSHGNHGIARHLAKALAGNAELLLTRKYRRSISKTEIVAAAGGIHVQVYPDVSASGLKRVAPSVACALDNMLFGLCAPLISARIKRMGIKRLFVLLGADTWFLPNILRLQKYGLETDLYLVDDIEASARYGHNRVVAEKAHKWLEQALTQSGKVWAISEAFAVHLARRFQIEAHWLPIPCSDSPPRFLRARSASGEARSIVFLGGLNHLYLEPLRVLYKEISMRNERYCGQQPIILDLLTYSQPMEFLESLPDTKWVKVAQNLSLPERTARMSNALALFLPYSFEEVEKPMVSTSFSCKLLEYFMVGRPILVYGPEYASIPRYFRKEGLSFCATHVDELREHLQTIVENDGVKFLDRYREVWSKYHSSEAIRKRLFDHCNSTV